MCLRYLPQQLHLVITSKSVPTAMEGFHRVRRGLPGRLEAGITLSIGNTPSPEGLYLIGNCHDVRLLQIWITIGGVGVLLVLIELVYGSVYGGRLFW